MHTCRYPGGYAPNEAEIAKRLMGAGDFDVARSMTLGQLEFRDALDGLDADVDHFRQKPRY